MRLNQLNGKELVERTRGLVAEERRITLELIEHLREIERRMLFCELGYGSLFDFCVRHLGLSEGSAQRRISAMRLSRDLPEVKPALATGEISLTNASKLHAVFQARKRQKQGLKREDKLELLQQVSGMTQRECETKLFEVVPEAMKVLTQERERQVSPSSTEIRLVVSEDLHEKLTRLKSLLSHKIPSGSTLEMLEYLVEKELRGLEKKLGLVPDVDDATPSSTATPVQSETTRSDTHSPQKDSAPIGPSLREPIPAWKKRVVWKRAEGKCQIPGCNSRYQLQVDHVISVALGGTNELKNLRLVCRNHNVHAARKKLGPNLMKKYLPRLSGR